MKVFFSSERGTFQTYSEEEAVVVPGPIVPVTPYPPIVFAPGMTASPPGAYGEDVFLLTSH